jgi:hypothetical protein
MAQGSCKSRVAARSVVGGVHVAFGCRDDSVAVGIDAPDLIGVGSRTVGRRIPVRAGHFYTNQTAIASHDKIGMRRAPPIDVSDIPAFRLNKLVEIEAFDQL